MFKKRIVVVTLVSICSGVGAQTVPDSLRKRVECLVNEHPRRYHANEAGLNSASEYIFNEFSRSTPAVRYQDFSVNGREYRNVIARVGDTTQPLIVIGAHYDVCDALPGADDNASGVAGIIEALHQLKTYKGDYCLEFVAYTLEEPPYFGTKYMGSYIHAQELMNQHREVAGMISVEMIGYFSDEKKSQSYPFGIMSWFYGSRGDYILLTKKMVNGPFVRKFTRNYKRSGMIRTKKIGAPKSLTGIDFSDHRNYWLMDIDALMITDTSFYRNQNYHHATDTPDTLDYVRMAQVVDALVAALAGL